MKKNILVITFLQRAWPLLVAVVFFNYLTIWKHIFMWVDSGARDEWNNIVWRPLTLADIWGAPIFMPAMGCAVIFLTLFFIHLRYRDTIDKDIHDGDYIADWKNMGTDAGARHRVWVHTVVFIGILLSLCVLFAGLAKG